MNTSRLPSDRLALMRHCQESGPSSLTPRSMSHTEKNCATLLKLISHRKFAIFYSTTVRAELTAKLVAEFLLDEGAEVNEPIAQDWIEDFMLAELCEEGYIREKIEILLETHFDSFILIIGHQDDIAGYLDLKMDDVLYCAIYGSKISILGHARF